MMGDLISRSKAVDAMTDDNIIRNMDSVYDSALHRIKRSITRILAGLPSANPNTKEHSQRVESVGCVGDTISREAAIDAIKTCSRHCIDPDDYYISAEDAEYRINALPSVTPKRKCGKWNAYYHGINETPSFTYSCNQCGYSAPYGLYGGKYSQKEWNFCPNCGADMRGEQDA